MPKNDILLSTNKPLLNFPYVYVSLIIFKAEDNVFCELIKTSNASINSFFASVTLCLVIANQFELTIHPKIHNDFSFRNNFTRKLR